MTRYLIRLALIACAFYFLFPMIHGVHFHGTFVHAFVAGAVFAFLGWLVELLSIMLSAVLTIGTLGMALLVLIPAWFFGFWLLPAITLKLVAMLMPGTLSFSGWFPAIVGGLVMMVIGMLTGTDVQKKIRRLE